MVKTIDCGAAIVMDLSLLWEQVDTLRALEKAPVLATDRRFALPDDPKIAEDHMCGPLCPHIIANDSGDFTCTRSGFCFGRQIAAGCNEQGQVRGLRPWGAAPPTPPPAVVCTTLRSTVD